MGTGPDFGMWFRMHVMQGIAVLSRFSAYSRQKVERPKSIPIAKTRAENVDGYTCPHQQ